MRRNATLGTGSMANAACLCAALMFSASAFAQGNVPSFSAQVNFSQAQAPEDATWASTLLHSQHGLTVTANEVAENGLLVENWVQSGPIPSSLSWRLPSLATVTMDLRGESLDGLSPVPAPLRAFVRYSMDNVHWSTWYAMPLRTGGTEAHKQYRATIELPTGARIEYGRLRSQWLATSPTWTSDFHEFYVWIAENEPEFFATEKPFIGYLQVRVEGVRDGTVVTSLDVQGTSIGSGVSAIPGAQRRADADDPWFFDLSDYVD